MGKGDWRIICNCKSEKIMFKKAKWLNWKHLQKVDPMLNSCPHPYHSSRVLVQTHSIFHREWARNKSMFIWHSITYPISFHRPSAVFNSTRASYFTRILLSPSGTTTITLTLDGEWGSAEVRVKDIQGQGRAQRTKLAPLSKTCKVMAAKQCLRSLLLNNVAAPVLNWIDKNRKQFRAKRWV